MKNARFIVIPLIVASVIVAFLATRTSLFKKEVVYIAVAGPLSGSNQAEGEAMLKGVRLYLEKITREGIGLEDKEIQILPPFDDEDNPYTAVNVASRIIHENKALLVLGHYSSPPSLTAGELYKKNEIAAITASATDEDITVDNDWYFRIVPNNKFQAAFIAHYIKNSLKRDRASIILANNQYGTSLTDAFKETAGKLGIEIVREWVFAMNSEEPDQELEKIVSELRKVEDPGMIFLAMPSLEAVRIMALLQGTARQYSFIGPDRLSTNVFLKAFMASPDSSHEIYAISPFIKEISGEKAYQFEREFEKRYHEKPSWIAACYYDAMRIAVEAMKHANIQGKGHIHSDRRRIREALTTFYSPENAIEGVSGHIYFDKHGDVVHPPGIGFYEKQRFLPAFSQYQKVRRTNAIENIFEKALKGEIILIDGNIMNQTPVVYAGIEIRKISDFDIMDSRYNVDFYLWFRFQGDFRDTNIEFVNALNPIILGQPVDEETVDGITTRLYRVKAAFKDTFNFQAYPLDRHTLHIRFRHAEQTQDKLVYVQDVLGLPRILMERTRGTSAVSSAEGWKITDISFYQDILTKTTTFGMVKFSDTQHRLQYSQYNAAIHIARTDMRTFVKRGIPILLLLVVAIGMFFLPPDRFGFQVVIYLVALFSSTFYHDQFIVDLPGGCLTLLEYGIFTVYGFIALFLLISISNYTFYKRRLALLQGIYLFQSLPDRIKSSLSKKMRRYWIKKPDHVIIRQGDSGDSFFVIFKGELSVWIQSEGKPPIEVNRMKAGDFFGEITLLTGSRISATVISMTPVFLGEITKADIAPFLKERPELVIAMSKELVRRKLHEMQKIDPDQAQQTDVNALLESYSQKIAQFLE